MNTSTDTRSDLIARREAMGGEPPITHPAPDAVTAVYELVRRLYWTRERASIAEALREIAERQLGEARKALKEVKTCISHQDFMQVRRVVEAALSQQEAQPNRVNDVSKS